MNEKQESRLEILTVGSMWPAMGMSVVGVGGWLATSTSQYAGFALLSLVLMVLGLALAGLSVAASYPLSTLRKLAARFTGGTRYDREKHWANLKTASLLLNGIAVGGGLLFIVTLMLRGGWVQAEIRLDMMDRGVAVLALAAAAAQAMSHHYSLRFKIERDQSGTRLILTMLGVILVGLTAMVAGLAMAKGTRIGGGLELGRDSVPMLVLGGHIFAAFSLFVSRQMPTFSILFNEDREYAMGKTTNVRSGHVFAPVLLAFGLLLLVFLMFVVFGVGVIDLISNVARSPVVLGSLVFLVLAVIVSLAAAMGLARDRDKDIVLWQAPQTAREQQRYVMLGISIGGAVLMGFLALLTWLEVIGLKSGAWTHFFSIGILVGVGPYGFYMSSEHKRIRQLEERFPDFLRDVASSHRGGLTLAESVRVASRGEYGRLTPEVRKMADQLSWNVPFNESLVRFGDRVQTPLVQRAVSLILESNRSGGSTTDVLLAAARDAREIKNLETERRLSMALYTVVIYITFFVFLSVAAIMYGQFVPQIVASSEAAQAAGPGLQIDGVGGESLSLEQFQRFYFLAAVMQGLGDGIVAGMMGSGQAVLGLRHSFLMVLISYVLFSLFLV